MAYLTIILLLRFVITLFGTMNFRPFLPHLHSHLGELDTCTEPVPIMLLDNETAIVIAAVFGALISIAMGAYLMHCYRFGTDNLHYQRLEDNEKRTG